MTADETATMEITVVETTETVAAPKKKRAAKKSKLPFCLTTDFEGTESFTVERSSHFGKVLYQMLCYADSSYAVRRMNHVYPVAYIEMNLEGLKSAMDDYGHDIKKSPNKEFFAVMDDRSAQFKAESEARSAQGMMLFQDLPFIYKPGTEIIVGRDSDAVAGIVTESKIERSFFGPYFSISYKTIKNTTNKNQITIERDSIGFWRGLERIDRTNIRQITAEEKAALAVRGAAFRKFTSEMTHASYTGMITQPTWAGLRQYRADGRIMIDGLAMQNAEPSLFSRYQSRDFDEDDSNNSSNEDPMLKADSSIPDESLWLTSPYLIGFSFACKQWGQFRVLGLRPIDWRTDAFDKVVLPSEDKEVVRALVEHNQGSFTDIIDGKGGGTIFLLHGEPGQGKTLLAETTAELLQRPLYTISVGELGISPDELEARLRKILDLATTWNAVLLLDEADIFLEERNERDIVRNAMVGVFLRLLEYHQGVLFLTTNRVKNIDRAFYSRISVALQFESADEAKLTAIWRNLLASAGVSGIDPELLAREHDHLNGRQIKNAIRLAQTLSKAQGTEITLDHFRRTIDLGTRFTREFITKKQA